MSATYKDKGREVISLIKVPLYRHLAPQGKIFTPPIVPYRADDRW